MTALGVKYGSCRQLFRYLMAHDAVVILFHAGEMTNAESKARAPVSARAFATETLKRNCRTT